MVSTSIALALADSGCETVLMDADVGTAGLSNFMSGGHVTNTRVGLSNIVAGDDVGVSELLQDVKSLPYLKFLAVGDHRKLQSITNRLGPLGEYRSPVPQAAASEEFVVSHALERVTSDLAETFAWLIVDCRGGIDSESLAVCRSVEDIILVTEPDVTAYQATRNLVDVLADSRLAHKLRGFYVNKVFQNPTFIKRQGTAEFGCQFLAAIPFDIQTTREFFVGDLPSDRSSFQAHVTLGLARVYPEVTLSHQGRIWEFHEFDRVAVTDPDGTRGGNAAAIGLVLIAVIAALYSTLGYQLSGLGMAIAAYALVVGLIGSLLPLRRLFGRAVGVYARAFGNIFGR